MPEETQAKGLRTPIRFLKGVGEARAELLSRMDIHTVGDLLLHLPHRYEDRSSFTAMRDLQAGMAVSIRGKVVACGRSTPKFGKPFFEAVLGDGSALVSCRWFGAGYIDDAISMGMELIAHGKVTNIRGTLVMTHPEFEVDKGEDAGSLHLNRIVPVYGLTDKLPQRTVRKLLYLAVEEFGGMIRESIPSDILETHGLTGIQDAVREIHFPTSMELAMRARYRLVFEEFLCVQIVLARNKSAIERITKGHQYAGGKGLKRQFVESLGFELTTAQQRCIDEISEDMHAEVPMHRLLQGDVGSGKTVVAACALLDAIDGGAQAAIMAPTEVLAQQHFKIFSQFLTRLGVESAILTGELSAAQRRNAQSGLKSGRIKLVVGTHALIYDKVQFETLGLIVIDEQHKFGVEQRGLLYDKGAHPDVLVMTATPIPRTMGMTIYGDLDVSTINELPRNRQEIVTRVVGRDQLEEAYAYMGRQVEKGRQCYMVYPLVEESDKLDLKSATVMFEELAAGIFKNVRMGLLHGQLDNREKNAVMKAFKEHELDILVSTTVIEVGIDVPNATVMLIENAERFGLAQLHQLRGRVGRGAHKSYCILQGDPKSAEAWQRLKIMEETQDGFRIAEEDLKIRGMGNLLGKEQSGFPTFKFGDPIADAEILVAARKEAFAVVQRDPDAVEPEYQRLYRRAEIAFNRLAAYAQVG